ncbi:mediator of RNA polymerase II transcription subunit 21 isoform X2 [Apium graveolens]|uniref:mediator of RNA polymerase II transcription subunit 21 isoform X2 n=1 Tax=Apium graveolens TaxID=4045 RepID=UPI003D7A6549
MDIISQLQEQVSTIAGLAVNTYGTLQRDAPPVRLSPNYPEPPPPPTSDDTNFSDQPKLMSSALVDAAKKFDALVTALPLSEGGEEAQLRRIAELQAENDIVGQELQKQLEAAGNMSTNRSPMGRSSNSSSSVKKEEHQMCLCGRRARICVSWTLKNSGRRFYTCAIPKGNGNDYSLKSHENLSRGEVETC